MMRTVILIIFSFLMFSARAEHEPVLTALNQQGQQQRQAAELLRYYRGQALDGDAHAQFRVGYAYETGDGLPTDDDKAVSWYKRAAHQGHRNAIMNLAAIDEKDRPFVDPESEYEKELTAKAREGDVDARNQLARMLVNNVLGNPDYRQIYSWIKELALADDRDSQFLMAQMYEMGIAAPQNYILAYAWYSVAAAYGNEQALLNRDSIAARMSQQQLEKGQDKSAEYFESYAIFKKVEKAEKNSEKNEIKHPGRSILEDEVVSQTP